MVFIPRGIDPCYLSAVKVDHCDRVCLLERYVRRVISRRDIFRLQILGRIRALFQDNACVCQFLPLFCTVICGEIRVHRRAVLYIDHGHRTCRVCGAVRVPFPRLSFICSEDLCVIRGKCHHIRLHTCLICLRKCQCAVLITCKHCHAPVVRISCRLHSHSKL